MKLHQQMSNKEVIKKMYEKDGGTLLVLGGLNDSYPDELRKCLFILDKFGIYGENIYKLWVNVCGGIPDHLFETVKALEEKKLDKEQILSRLKTKRPRI